MDNRNSRTDFNTKLYLFNVGDKIDNSYTVINQIGRGGYGEIYKARRSSDGLIVAVKVEKSNKPGNLVQEIRVLKFLQDCGARHIPKLLSAGRHLGISYMVMELLGQNLFTYRNHRPSLIFTLRCTCIIAILMLKAIKQVHDHGFLHRDIKPTNFVVGSLNNPRELFIIDFGLSRQYVRPDGTLIAKRPRSRWAGSWRYMSPNVHLQKDHGRRDDMWGFLYVIIELYSGTLPWRSIKGPKNVDRIRDIKLAYMNERLTYNLPDEFTLILNHIRTLSFESRPNYRYLHTLLMTMYLREGGTKDSARYDWEDETSYNELYSPSGGLRISISSIHSDETTPKEQAMRTVDTNEDMSLLQDYKQIDNASPQSMTDIGQFENVFVNTRIRLSQDELNEDRKDPGDQPNVQERRSSANGTKKISRYKKWKSKLKHHLTCHVQ